MGRFFIFLRKQEHANCDSLTYWKPWQQGGCFVGKLDDEREAIRAAEKIYQTQEGMSYHIVDTETHSIIITRTSAGIKDLRKPPKKQNKIPIPKNITQTTLTYDNGTIEITYEGDDNE